VNRYTNLEIENQLSKEDIELAKKINRYFIEVKPIHRQHVLDYFGLSKDKFYKLKNAKAIQIPEYISNKSNSNALRVYKKKDKVNGLKLRKENGTQTNI
jgi:hypothetical protein